MLLGLTLLLASTVAAVLIFVGDSLYYSNRDVTYWAYTLNSAIPGAGFLIAAALVQTAEVSLNKINSSI